MQAKTFKNQLGTTDLGRIEQQSGPGAGGYLMPGEGNPRLVGPHFKVATRSRLLCAELVVEGANTCCHRNGVLVCGLPKVGGHGKHATQCQIGGGVIARHSTFRDTVAKWLEEIGYQPKREQAMPKWNTESERSIMDVVYIDNAGRGISIDTAVIDGAEGGPRSPTKFVLPRMEQKTP